jgi:uncharacterized membrane protein
MWWWGGYHGWWPGPVLMAVFMLACVAGMALMMGHGRMSAGMGGMCGFWRRNHSRAHRTDTPVQILDERLARGEIDIREYLRRLETLADNSPAGSEEHVGSPL